MRRRVPAIIPLMCLAAFLLASGPAIAVDELSVKMWYPDTVAPGQTAGVSLEIRNENYDYLVNITWTGINIEWMAPGEFAYNTTSFELAGGQSRIVNITLQVPADAKAGVFSNYEVIHYTIQNKTGGEWSNATWESTITDDFNVTVDSKPPPKKEEDGGSPWWYKWAIANIFCLCGGLIVIIVVLAAAAAARRGVFQRLRKSHAGRPSFRPSASPPPGYPAPEFPPPAYEESKPRAAEEPVREPGPAAPAVLPEETPVPPQAQRPVAAPSHPPATPALTPDRGVDLMKPTDWDAIGMPAPSTTSGPPAEPAASLGPKFCTYCGAGEPGPVCRNCGRSLV